jgi:hypothetical protein
MHWEKASSGEFAEPLELAEPERVDEPPGSVDDGLLLHADASRTNAAAAMAAARAVGLGPGFMPVVLRPGG